MSVILGTLFVGVTFLANGYGLIPNDEVPIIAQTAEAVFGAGSIGFFLFLKAWQRTLPDVPLVIVETPYRSLVVPFLHYLDVMAPSDQDVVTIVVLPEYVPRHLWDRVLYNQTAAQLKNALVGRPETVVAEVPYGSKHRHAGISFRGLWRRHPGVDEGSGPDAASTDDAASD